MGNLIFGSTTVAGRSFDNIKIQTSRAGVARPIVFGRVRPIVGNIIATTAPRIEKTTEKQDGGKGGPSVEVENEEVFRTYAIRICEGPVTGIRRVWRNNELVYHRDDNSAVQRENNRAFLQYANFFLGSFSQQPSAVLQAAFGVQNVHAYRGTCYLVMDDENLTSTGGAIPQYAFEVERAEGFTLTSRPYAVESREDLQADFKAVRFSPSTKTDAAMSSQFAAVTASLRPGLSSYDGYPVESFTAAFTTISATLTSALTRWDDYPPEGFNAAFVGVSGQLTPALVRYDRYEIESITATFSNITGTLE